MLPVSLDKACHEISAAFTAADTKKKKAPEGYKYFIKLFCVLCLTRFGWKHPKQSPFPNILRM